MRAVRSEEAVSRGECARAGVPGKVRRAPSLGSMSTPAFCQPMPKIRHMQAVDKPVKKKETYKNRFKKDGIVEHMPIGDNLEVCSNDHGHNVKDGSRPSTGIRCKTPNKDALVTHKDMTCDMETFRRCLTSGDYKSEKLLNSEQPKLNVEVLEEVKELLRRTEKKNADEQNKDTKDRSKIGIPRKRPWKALLVWFFTFTGALAFYFCLFIYTHKLDPFYSKIIEILGLKEEIPPPPPTITEQILQFFDQIGIKMNNLRLMLLEKLTLVQYQNKA